jgi:hypothetical protein
VCMLAHLLYPKNKSIDINSRSAFVVMYVLSSIACLVRD